MLIGVKMEKYCIACGMPLPKPEDIAKEGPLCKYCINEDGSVKTCQEVFDGGVAFFSGAVPGATKELAERICRKNMCKLPYWQGKNEECLKGEQATDEEFKETLEKLHSEIDKGNV